MSARSRYGIVRAERAQTPCRDFRNAVKRGRGNCFALRGSSSRCAQGGRGTERSGAEEGVSHAVPVDVPEKLGALILDSYT